MSARARLQNANDSKSLWNYTDSPGWSSFDSHVLRLAIMKYGCGSWRNISKHFPFKSCSQLNTQTQRLFGQQALAEFGKVHIDPNRIKQINDKIDGFRKNNCLINTGKNLSVQERDQKRRKHIEKYGIPPEIYENMQIPVVQNPPQPSLTLIDDIEKLREMYRCVYDMQLKLKYLKSNSNQNIIIRSKKPYNSNNNNNNNKNKIKLMPHLERIDIEMCDNNNSNSNNKNKNEKQTDDDVVIVKVVQNKKKSKKYDVISMIEPMDEDMELALALSASVTCPNNEKPKTITTKKKKCRYGSNKKKKGKKRSKKWEDDEFELYIPKPTKKRVRRK